MFNSLDAIAGLGILFACPEGPPDWIFLSEILGSLGMIAGAILKILYQ